MEYAPFQAPRPSYQLLQDCWLRFDKPACRSLMWPASTAQTAVMSISARRAAVESGIAIARPGTPGIELADALPPLGAASLHSGLLLSGDLQQLGEGEWAMQQTPLGCLLPYTFRGLAAVVGRDDACICRLQFLNCPRTSIYEASGRDFRVVLAGDAVSGIYNRGKDEMKNIGVSLMSAEDLAAAISSGSYARRG